MVSDNNTISTWWGNFKLEKGKSMCWRIGPLKFIVRCLDNEWQIAHVRSDESSEEVDWSFDEVTDLPDSLAISERYIFKETSGILKITPKLADRAIITRPLTPFNIIAGEEATLFVSTPLWIEFSVGKSKKILGELGILRPSDTWFGPSSREGELCYAGSTHCRLQQDIIPHRVHRAVTPVVVKNQADSTLSIERLKVPAPLLALYISPDNQFWTPKITLLREKDGDIAELKIDKSAPSVARSSSLLTKPRQTSESGVFIRAFNAVFG